jgi:hypothetical protein
MTSDTQPHPSRPDHSRCDVPAALSTYFKTAQWRDTELVDRPIQIDPSPGDFDVRFVHEPPIPGSVSAGSGRVDQQRSEPLHPAIDGDMIAKLDPSADTPRERRRIGQVCLILLSADATAPLELT